MKSFKTISLAIAMLFSIVIFANEITVTGTITDESGMSIPFVTITNKKKNFNIVSDLNGYYSIRVEKGNILKFSYTGYKNQTVIVKNETTINVVLISEVHQLNELVVVGYGSMKKNNLTGSVSKFKKKELSNLPAARVDQTLQGKIAGVQVTTANAKPTVQIRGVASINSNAEPLIIIDGQPSNRKMKDLDINTIKDVSVLKDAASAAIYGSRGAAGVILITTGKKSDTLITKTEWEQKINQLTVTQLHNEEPKTDEAYDAFVENPFESPNLNPLSTFSIDVDNASYTNIRRIISSGQKVPKDAVRIEEMLNFFKYQYPQPNNGEPFSIHTEYSNCPWNEKHQLLKIGLQGKIIPTDNLPNSNLVFLIDVSGSMSDENKLPLLKQSFKILVNELRPQDKVSIVVYAGAAGLVLPPTAGNDSKTIFAALDKLNAGGSTAGGAGIQLAYKIAEENFIKGGNNRVIIATDGDFNVGSSSTKDLEDLIEDKRKTGVFLTCLGYGMGNYKDNRLETLADKGNGNYAYIDNIIEANRFLSKEFKGSMYAIAKDVKIQIEFNPSQVKQYRLIGYENRKLNTEDFKNDAIDAGELGSGHSVTALYEIIPVGVESSYSLPELKYTKQNQSSPSLTNELATIKFRYKKPDENVSKELVEIIKNTPTDLQNASADFKFASAVSWFGLKLRDSDLVSNKNQTNIIALANQGKHNDNEGYQAEFVRLIEVNMN
jgi:Ca-activated chloride channel homolog